MLTPWIVERALWVAAALLIVLAGVVELRRRRRLRMRRPRLRERRANEPLGLRQDSAYGHFPDVDKLYRDEVRRRS